MLLNLLPTGRSSGRLRRALGFDVGALMPFATFYLGAAQLVGWIENVYSETDCVIYETYSQFDAEVQVFPTREAFLAACPIDLPTNSRSTYQLSVWSPSVMSSPHVKRIDLKVKGHSFRFVAEGCGLYSLLIRAAKSEGVRKCAFSYWSEAGAKQRCMVKPGPSAVNWALHKRLGASLARQAKRLANAL